MFHPTNSEYLPYFHHGENHTPARSSQLKRLFSALMPAFLAAVVALVALFVLLRPAHAVDCIVPDSYATIQDAVDDASCGVVGVRAGAYVENVVIDRDVEIYGAGPGSTVVNGGGVDSVFEIQDGATVVISRTTIRNGSASRGAGIYNSGHLTLVKSEVRENLATNRGGGIYSTSDATLVLEQSVVHSNEVDGNIVYGAGVYNLGTMTVTGSRVANNTGSGSQSHGGGIYNSSDASLFAQDLTLVDNVITGSISFGAGLNSAGGATLEGSLIAGNVITAGTGNGIGIYNSGALTGTSITVQDNLMETSLGQGGGLYNVGEAQVLESVFERNNAGYFGGAIYSAGSLRTEGTTYENNSATLSGGAIYNTGVMTATDVSVIFNNSNSGAGMYNSGSFLGVESILMYNTGTDGGGLYNTGSGVATLVRTSLIGNEATDDGGAVFNNSDSVTLVDSNVGLNSSEGDGGAIYNNDVLTLTRVAVYRNEAPDYGAGIYQDGGQLLATNVTFSNNDGNDTDAGGAALYLGDEAHVTLIHNTIVSNTVDGLESGGIVVETNAVLTMTGTIVGYNSNSNCDVGGSLNSGGYNLENANDCGLSGGGDLVNTAPQLKPFAQYGGYIASHALLAASPAVDAAAGGAPLCPDTDIRGVSRPVGAACDIGAFEALQLTIDDVEVDEDAGQVEFVVSAGAIVPELIAVLVDFETSDGTAVGGADYGVESGTVEIKTGNITGTVVVDIIDDNIDELDETFHVTLDNASNAFLAKASGEAVILDNDGPEIALDGDVIIEEGDTGSSIAEFTVSLSESSDQTVTVAYGTADGTATAGSDYVATSGTLTFAPGDTTQTINVEVLGDAVAEPDETFLVLLSNASNGSLAVDEATGTILDDDDGSNLYLPALYSPQ